MTHKEKAMKASSEGLYWISPIFVPETERFIAPFYLTLGSFNPFVKND